ncbi:uncharacterized protein [Watersipora subatra]|uniref:uncharacterized protein n=1 Tax=Watersipora subatra TaxID=2589382 RepID=UPI00355AEA2A
MPQHLTKEKRAVIIHLHQQGKSLREIAREVDCSKKGAFTTICRWKKTGQAEERAGRERKKLATNRMTRRLVRLSLVDRHLTRPPLAKQLKESTEDWKAVLFSDESTLTVQNHSGNNYVRRRPGEEFKPECILPMIKHPTSVMVWGCFSAAGPGRLDLLMLKALVGLRYCATVISFRVYLDSLAVGTGLLHLTELKRFSIQFCVNLETGFKCAAEVQKTAGLMKPGLLRKRTPLRVAYHNYQHYHVSKYQDVESLKPLERQQQHGMHNMVCRDNESSIYSTDKSYFWTYPEKHTRAEWWPLRT